jgi:hypothetical protein
MWQHGDELKLLQDAKRELKELAPEASPLEQPKAQPKPS